MEELRKIPFELQGGESVLLYCRRHWLFVVVQLVKNVLAGLLPIVALLVLANLSFGLDGRKGQVVGLICLAWFLLWVVRTYFAVYRYNNDIWVITNQRVVDSVKNHWFHHRMATADLDAVQDISINKSGLFGTTFNYGDLVLETAGERETFVLGGIPNPTTVLASIDKARDSAKRELRRPAP